jgi:TPR repeat protein
MPKASTITNATKHLPALALALALTCVASPSGFAGGGLYFRGDGEPVVLARGNARSLGRLGFRYENGFGVPQNYAAAADLYLRAAEQGDPFAQCRLGLSYDKGHGVPMDFILAYKWLDLATARASRRERDFYQRLRDAVAQKMSLPQVVEGQRLALVWSEHWASVRY